MDDVIGGGAGDDAEPSFGAIYGDKEHRDCDCDVNWDGDGCFNDDCWYFYHYYYSYYIVVSTITTIYKLLYSR